MADSRPRRPITIFSVLALVVLLTGVATVLYFRFFTIDSWINSGDRVPVGSQRTAGPEGTVELAQGQHVIYYESPVGVPQYAGMITFNLTAPDGSPLLIGLFHDDAGVESYGPRPVLSFTNMSGKPFWRVEAPATGVYQVFAKVEDDFLEDAGDDRIVFNKMPQLFSELNDRTRTMMIVLLSVTGGVFVILYILHAIALARRSRGDGAVRRAPMHLEPME